MFQAIDRLQRLRLEEKVRRCRRSLAESSLAAFGPLYLPHFLPSPDSSMHTDLYELLESLPRRPGARIAWAAPRGSAKSTVLGLIFVLRSICHRRHRFIVLISDTADKAADFLGHVNDELTSNEKLAADYPEVCETSGGYPRPPRWRTNEIITRNGVKITALGTGQSIRGRRHRQDRPDLIILDDIENQNNTASPEARKKLDEWFHKAVLKAGTPQTQVVMVGTIQHYDALLARLTDSMKSPLWHGLVYRSVLSWSDHPELWQAWSAILHGHDEYENGTGPSVARIFYENNKDAMLSGTEVLWPEVENYYTLMLMRESEGPASFDSEKQNEPINPDDCYFAEAEFRFWDDRWEDEHALIASLENNGRMIGACDPSLGKQGRHADDSAIVSLLCDQRTGALYVLDAAVARRKPDRIIEDILEYHRLRNYCRFAFESNQFQAFLAEELQRRSNAARLYLPVEPIQNTSDKLGRIQSLQPLVRSGVIQFSRRHKTLLDQLRLFPKADHDDGPDALEMAVAATRQFTRPGKIEYRVLPALFADVEGTLL